MASAEPKLTEKGKEAAKPKLTEKVKEASAKPKLTDN